MINSRLETLTGQLGDAKVKMLKLYVERERNGLSVEACANAAGYSKNTFYNTANTPDGKEFIQLYSQQLEAEGIKSGADVIQGEPLRVSNCLMMVYNQLSMKALRGEPRAIETLLKFSPVFTELEENGWKAKAERTTDIEAILAEVARL